MGDPFGDAVDLEGLHIKEGFDEGVMCVSCLSWMCISADLPRREIL